MKDDLIPEVPKNYINTVFGMLPNPNISEGTRKLHSMYFMVKQTKIGSYDLLNERDKIISVYIEESHDFEYPDDESVHESQVRINLELIANEDFEGLTSSLEKFASAENISLVPFAEAHKSKTYAFEECELSVEILYSTIANSPFSIQTQRDLVFEIRYESQGDSMSAFETVFEKLMIFQSVLKKHSIDMTSLRTTAFELEEEDIYFKHRFTEIPRQSPSEFFWKQLPKKELEPLIDFALNRHMSMKKEGTEEEQKITKETLDSIVNIYTTKE